ncbi:hypothetical protein N480_12445 [Pseudoalteromonas luteoviolacea S2607]|uniref:hypothetical protein n=1 Tax=Pseudoalteromonas luteoviolacea TaxID=43657 RepID=UPI0007B16E1E|nr:hypothetical protein [Pseudoalteromonas luteoviolacea]KZN38455.1 hypothetical protein N480_12445 [Pseudoalteromonas luteoviolacea S2607]
MGFIELHILAFCIFAFFVIRFAFAALRQHVQLVTTLNRVKKISSEIERTLENTIDKHPKPESELELQYSKIISDTIISFKNIASSIQNIDKGMELDFAQTNIAAGQRLHINSKHELCDQSLERAVLSAVTYYTKSINLRNTVVSDMAVLIKATDRIPLTKLDYWERLIRSTYHENTNECNNSLTDYKSVNQPMVTWLNLISKDGFEREYVIGALCSPAPNSFFFALALRRLNDWSSEVRSAARRQLPLVAEHSQPQFVAQAIVATLFTWSSWGRIEQQDKDVIMEIVSKPMIARELKGVIISSTSGAMTYLMAQIGRIDVLDSCLMEIALNAIQPSVRGRAYRSLFEKKMVWLERRQLEWTNKRFCKQEMKPVIGKRAINVDISFSELLNSSASDRSSIVRRVAAEMLIRDLQNLGEEAFYFASVFASDKSTAVAERGRFALRKLEETKLI